MDRQRFARAKALYLAVADLESRARGGYLLEHASDDAELRAEVEAWLAFDAGESTADSGAGLSLAAGIEAALGREDDAAPSLSPGERLGDRYRIEAFIDRGGMGEVYRATDQDLDAPVALKVIRRDFAAAPASLQRLKQEVLSARSVTHPNVCRIFDFGRDTERELSFLTMELLPGETLEARLRAEGPLTPEDARTLFAQLADALDSAHAAGIVHRDVKSANVMLVPSPGGVRPVITDFGLALPRRVAGASDAAPRPSAEPTAGTPAYMSPEQVLGHALGPASDLYSLGVVLYEALTGRRPFDGDTPLEVARARLHETPPVPSRLARLDPGWDPVILRLLEREPADRYATARAAFRALEGRAGAEPVVTPRHALPAEHDAFVGRAVMIERLTEQLERDSASSVLVTLVGPAGVGKTRLATHYARRHLERWPGGAWWCDLTEARDPADILAIAARSLGVAIGGADPAMRLGHAIAGRGRCLLVLDSVEQVVSHLHPVLDAWLATAPEVRVLVTSQERLRIPAETPLEVEPLDPGTEAVELFVARARAGRPLFRVDAAARPLIEEIVATLEGLPLAIELAAARLRMLSLEQLHDRIQDRLRVLVGGRRGRHETLMAALDWSWDLLTPTERSVVSQTSVFEGGFRLEAAEAVVDVPERTAPVIDVLQSLVDKSWLRARVVAGAPRFDTYTTVHAYARRALDTARADGVPPVVEVEARHARHFATMDTADVMRDLNRAGGIDRLSRELGNLIAACRRSMARGDVGTATRAFAVAMAVLRRTGPVDLAIDLAHEMLAAPDLAGREFARDRARVQRYLGVAAAAAGRWAEAQRQGEIALEAYRALGERHDEAKVLNDLGDVTSVNGDEPRALELHGAALDAYREVGDRDGEGYSLSGLGFVYWRLGRGDESLEHFEAALGVLRETGNRRMQGFAHFGLGAVHYNAGRYAQARRHYEAAIELFREAGDRAREGTMLCSLGALYLQSGAMERARDGLERARVIAREVGSRSGEGHALTALGLLHANQGRFDEAERHLDAALQLVREIENRSGEGLVQSYLGHVEQGRGNTDAARRRYEKSLAIHRDVGPRSQEAYALTALGGVHRDQGRLADARSAFDDALAICRETDWRMGEGPIRVGLGGVDRLEGRLDEAHASVETGIEIMRRSEGDTHRLGLALCELAEVRRARGEIGAAHEALAEAEVLAESLGVMPASALASAVRGVRDVLLRDDGP